MIISAVVLSNAYKNNNVYNMITEREDIPYTLVSQLENDKFSIYTRPTDFNIGKLNSSLFRVPLKLYRHDLHHAAAGIFISNEIKLPGHLSTGLKKTGSEIFILNDLARLHEKSDMPLFNI